MGVVVHLFKKEWGCSMEYQIIDNINSVNRYSFSKLNGFHTCPYYWDLNYNKHIKGTQNAFAKFGTIIHGLMEKYFKNEIAFFEIEESLKQQVSEQIPEGIVFKTPTYNNKLTDKYIHQTLSFLHTFDGLDQLEVVGIEKEFEFLTQIYDKKFILTGFIDIVAQDKDGELYVIDWKSKGKFKSKQELHDYARQLYIYSLYIEWKYGKKPKELWFYQFRLENIEKIPFSQEDFEESLQWTYDTIDLIENEQFFCKKRDLGFCTNLCNYGQNTGICDYRQESI